MPYFERKSKVCDDEKNADVDYERRCKCLKYEFLWHAHVLLYGEAGYKKVAQIEK